MAVEHKKNLFSRKEYQTQWIKEKNYLESVGIRYSFVKSIDGISTFCYHKEMRLFEALTEFYRLHEAGEI